MRSNTIRSGGSCFTKNFKFLFDRKKESANLSLSFHKTLAEKLLWEQQQKLSNFVKTSMNSIYLTKCCAFVSTFEPTLSVNSFMSQEEKLEAHLYYILKF